MASSENHLSAKQQRPERDSSQAKKSRILEAATEVFATVGYQAADVQDIADKAHVGKGTVYRHFESKENLFWECGIRIFRLLEEVTENALSGGGTPLERLFRTVDEVTSIFFENPYSVSIVMQVRFARERIPEKVEWYLQHKIGIPMLNLYQEAIEQGFFPPGEPRDYSISVMDSLWGITVFHRVSDDAWSLKKRIVFTLESLLKGMLTEKGMKSLLSIRKKAL